MNKQNIFFLNDILKVFWLVDYLILVWLWLSFPGPPLIRRAIFFLKGHFMWAIKKKHGHFRWAVINSGNPAYFASLPVRFQGCLLWLGIHYRVISMVDCAGSHVIANISGQFLNWGPHFQVPPGLTDIPDNDNAVYAGFTFLWIYYKCDEGMRLLPLFQLHSWSCGHHKIQIFLHIWSGNCTRAPYPAFIAANKITQLSHSHCHSISCWQLIGWIK